MLAAEMLSSLGKIETLHALYRQPVEIGLRQIANLSSSHVRSTELALRQLTHEGIVKRSKRGNRTYFWLNTEHLFYPTLKSIFAAFEAYDLQTRANQIGDKGASLLRFVDDANRMITHARKNRHGT